MSPRHLLTILPVLALFACKEQPDTGDSAPPTDSGDTDTADTEDTDDTGDSVDTDDTDDTEDTADTVEVCWVDDGAGTCWDCALPEAPEADSNKALNACTEVAGVPFDNAARIPASTWVPGTPLPPIP